MNIRKSDADIHNVSATNLKALKDNTINIERFNDLIESFESLKKAIAEKVDESETKDILLSQLSGSLKLALELDKTTKKVSKRDADEMTMDIELLTQSNRLTACCLNGEKVNADE